MKVSNMNYFDSLWNLILFKGSSSMEEHLPYRKEVGGSIPPCPIYRNKWIQMTKYTTSWWKMIIKMTKYMTNGHKSVNKWLNILLMDED